MWATNLKVVTVAVVVVLFYTAVAHLIPQIESAVPEAVTLGPDASPTELAAAGERLYNGIGNCVSCHGLGVRAPNLLSDHEGRGTIGARCVARFDKGCKEYLYTSLTNPTDSVVAGFAPIMPDMRTQLPGEIEVWALVAYLQSMGGEITVTADDLANARTASAAAAPAPQSAATGTSSDDEALAREVIQGNGCVACHQLDGVGAPLGPPFDGIGARLSADEIRQAILDPNATISPGYETVAGTMPPTFGSQLTALELEAVVRFLAGRR